MSQVFSLPGAQTSLWVEGNDAEVGLSELEVTKDHVKVPRHIYEDSLCESETLTVIRETGGYVYYPSSEFEEIQKHRRNSYRACVWYPEIASRIPTAPSILVEGSENLAEYLDKHLSQYPFVRTCQMSPKDISATCLFSDPTIALEVLSQSERTRCIHHLFLRERRQYQWEVRCFWSRDQLRAISMPRELDEEERALILDFFETLGDEIPYHSATVDLGYSSCLQRSDGQRGLELIEFNTFGPDMRATSGNFSWREDVMTLLFSPTPVFR